ncbi:MAG: ferritin-like domain-containing protein [Acidimicrobiia bacterium]|nr:ferritin-like domain-containing protein [Acidimicrobiia bacterium]
MGKPVIDWSYVERVQRGELDLEWLRQWDHEVEGEIVPSRIGLTLRDIAVGQYGEIPETAPMRTMAPRGSQRDPDLPDMGYTINTKDEVWAENVMDLYEEGVSRQWSATRDIPWTEIPDLDPDIEHAMCQFSTFLSEVEMIASDFPAKWMWQINHDYVETKMFLASQIMDEARHTEVFRKRALAKGGGLGRAKTTTEYFLKLVLDAQNYQEGSALMHLLGEGMVLSVFRAGELISPSPVEKKIFRLCMQDEARHVAYGTMHLRHVLEQDPDKAEEFHEYLDAGEEIIAALFTVPEVVEPLTVIIAGGIDAAADVGDEASNMLQGRVITEYLQRCDRAGLDRRSRIKIPGVLTGFDPATAGVTSADAYAQAGQPVAAN